MHGGRDLRRFYRYDWRRQDIQIIAEMGRVGWRGKQFATPGAERGVMVTHKSILHWCLKFGADFAKRLRRCRPQPGDTWHLDEVFIRIRACCTICGTLLTSMASC